MLQRFGLLTTFLVAVALIAWTEMRYEQRVPRPERFVFVGLVWATLGIISDLVSPELAALFGVGLVLTLLYRQRRVIGDSARSSVDHTVPGES